MPDWTASMKQTYEFYKVDPDTWNDSEELKSVISCSIDWDSSTSTMGSATIEMTEEIGECYVRIYLITIQNGLKERFVLGTFLIQAPSVKFDGRNKSITYDGYSPLIELKEKNPPLGYSIIKASNIMDYGVRLTSENLRAPVVGTTHPDTLISDFVASVDDTWCSFLEDLIANAKYSFGVTERGQIIFMPDQEISSLQSKWTFDDGNSSILYSEVTVEKDIFEIPNVVEVVYSNAGLYLVSKVINEDPNSPFSTVSRGREITKRITNPEIAAITDQKYVNEYAAKTLKNLSSQSFTVTYTHGYCPVRVGDCITLNYPKSKLGLSYVRAKIIKQSIKCEPGCPVEETAIVTIRYEGDVTIISSAGTLDNVTSMDRVAYKELVENWNGEKDFLEELGLSEYLAAFDSYLDPNIANPIPTKFGNIDMNNRIKIVWDAVLKNTFSKALASWEYDPEIGGIDTVFGGSMRIETDKLPNGVEVAFTPIMLTENSSLGFVFLREETVMAYLEKLVDFVISRHGSFSASRMILYDAVGMQANGTFVHGIIGACDTGLNYDNNGNRAETTGRLMHFAGDYGAISLAYKDMKQAADELGITINEFLSIFDTRGEVSATQQKFN